MTFVDPARPWTIVTGDCRETMRRIDPESVDAVVTDTPYGLSTLLDPPNLDREALWKKLTAGLQEAPIKVLLRAWLDTGENPPMKGKGFMGKEWDALVPPPNTWREAWRVMKPGAYLFAFGGARTYDLIKVAIRLADFEADDDICTWLYGQGMPKRVRLGLKVQNHKRGSRDRERPDVGRRDNLVYSNRAEAGFRNEPLMGLSDDPDVQRFAGHDRSLKPGYEPIIVAQKPLRGTIATNALRYGTGGMHVDACRIERGGAGEVRKSTRTGHDENRKYGHGLGDGDGEPIAMDARGGYPTNVIMGEGAAAELDTSVTGRRFGGSAPASGPTFDGPNESVAHGRRNGMNGRPAAFHGEVDGPSRFFYVAKASTSERDKGLDALPVLTPGERSDREDGTAGINGYAGTRGEARNPHTCVKPVVLMQDLVREAVLRYVARLASPPGSHAADMASRPLVLDPFAGSGSTGVACMVEGLRFVGCEMDETYAAVARARLQHAYHLPREAGEAGDEGPAISSTTGQVSLF